MTKDEAIKEMEKGKKITHYHFAPEEWITIKEGRIVLEDGVNCSPFEFWRWRTHESWKDGYLFFIDREPKSKII